MRILSEIRIYPIKSLGGIALTESKVEPRGLQYDRRWMLVDDTGRFVSQREIPAMALLGTAVEPPHLVVFLKGTPAEKVRIPLDVPMDELETLNVEIWDDQCRAGILPRGINDWFSDNLKQRLRLVYMPDTTRRWADEQYAPKGQHVSFADGYPFLIIGQASLDDLNSRLDQPLPMNRFRPNFVFTGGEPFEEDTWGEFEIGNVKFQGVKPCARCIIPTTDQETAERAAEPLKTLATFRKRNNKIYFGQNLVWLGEENPVIGVGASIQILSNQITKEPAANTI
ncbi:MAG TPA: MOSC domain-containing protein [Saprospiraceae bacterium]|nr:MOSC domain-containing protein [Saprospiraceae bacterium]